ncbi:unnamed protein product [Allacma fusca]|uniref:Uncharacterized protein n=1 Tax=Allacma fusca TaxID=39272 RepID=A0A8J2NVU8_9HEXA|nr:unnamed protein product [Allacma fusca]
MAKSTTLGSDWAAFDPMSSNTFGASQDPPIGADVPPSPIPSLMAVVPPTADIVNPFTQQSYAGHHRPSHKPPPEWDNRGYHNDHEQNYYPGPIPPMESPAPVPLPNNSGNS